MQNKQCSDGEHLGNRHERNSYEWKNLLLREIKITNKEVCRWMNNVDQWLVFGTMVIGFCKSGFTHWWWIEQTCFLRSYNQQFRCDLKSPNQVQCRTVAWLFFFFNNVDEGILATKSLSWHHCFRWQWAIVMCWPWMNQLWLFEPSWGFYVYAGNSVTLAVLFNQNASMYCSCMQSSVLRDK